MAIAAGRATALFAALLAWWAAAAAAANPAVPAEAWPEVHPRLEVRRLFSDPLYSKHRDLYLLALAAMQAAPPTDPDSYLQQAGMHGFPFIPYRNASNPDPEVLSWDEDPDPMRWGGYCPHGSTEFPVWHRAHTLEFERALQRWARRVAAGFGGPDAAAWQRAALELRAPYLDFTTYETIEAGLPAFLFESPLAVMAPAGPARIPNPLAGYTIPSDVPLPPFDSCEDLFSDVLNITLGCTTARDGQGAINRRLVGGVARQLRGQIAQVLASPDWHCVANNRSADWGGGANAGAFEDGLPPASESLPSPAGRCSNQTSLEGAHNTVHKVLGGARGWMSDPGVASFDPIFFLHHANVDRLLAAWQLAHPGVWMAGERNPFGNFFYPVGTLVEEDTPLAPFWHPDREGEFYTSLDLRDWRALGYTYDTLEVL